MADRLAFTYQQQHNLNETVQDYVDDGRWCLPDTIRTDVKEAIEEVSFLQEQSDVWLWRYATNGNFTVKTCYRLLHGYRDVAQWNKFFGGVLFLRRALLWDGELF